MFTPDSPARPDPVDIIAARQAARVTRDQAAALIGARPATMSAWEAGRSQMPSAGWELLRRRLRQCALSSVDEVLAQARQLQRPTPEQIRAARTRCGLNRPDAGSLVGAGKTTWATWESGADTQMYREMPLWIWMLFLELTSQSAPEVPGETVAGR
jgi:DNA-binding transcriptional regulator YiaG